MPARENADSLPALAAAAIATDPALQNRVRKMVDRIIAHVDFTMSWGKTEEKNALMKAVVPAMMRSMAVVDEESGKRAQQESYDRLREALGGDA